MLERETAITTASAGIKRKVEKAKIAWKTEAYEFELNGLRSWL
jgi:hypothetical protein